MKHVHCYAMKWHDLTVSPLRVTREDEEGYEGDAERHNISYSYVFFTEPHEESECAPPKLDAPWRYVP